MQKYGLDSIHNVVLLAHLPIVIAEGLVTGSVVVLLRKVRPELLQAPLLLSPRGETDHD